MSIYPCLEGLMWACSSPAMWLLTPQRHQIYQPAMHRGGYWLDLPENKGKMSVLSVVRDK